MIKFLVLDLDGTLLDSQGKVSSKNKSAIIAAQKQGALITVATGRRFRDARPVALEIGFNLPIITHNGALIKFAESLEIFNQSIIKQQTINEILRIGKEFGSEVLVSTDPLGKGTLFYDTVSEKNIPLQKYIVWSKILHGKEAEESVIHVNNLHEAVKEAEVIHISFSGTCEPMAELETILKTELGNSVNVLATRYPHLDFTLLDILPPNTSKATAIDKIATKHDISSKNVMAVGDNFNDVEMLEYAGLPIIMGNAAEGLLHREEFYKTLSNDENGVAEAINKYILGDING